MIERSEMVGDCEKYMIQLVALSDAQGMSFMAWESRVEIFLLEAFGEKSWQIRRFRRLAWTNTHYSYSDGFDHASYAKSVFQRAKENAHLLLGEVLKDLKNTKIDSKVFHRDNTGVNQIFLTHGRNEEWKDVQRFLEKRIGIPVIELSQAVSGGRTIIEKLEEESDKCNFAVIIMSGDDSDADGIKRVRENVMHEIGFFQGKYGRKNVCLLHQEGVSIPTNIGGIVYLPYPSGTIRATFSDLEEEIRSALGIQRN